VKFFQISDKKLGYITFCFILALFIWAGIEMILQSKHTLNRISIQFDQVGTLQPQDRIVEKGVPIGRVLSIVYQDKKALVVVDFDQPIKLRTGTIIRNTNYSLMGDRMLILVRSRTGKLVSENYLWQGVFESGIAEALHLMDGVLGNVLEIQYKLVKLLNGDSSSPSLIKEFANLIETTENTLVFIEKQITAIQKPLRNTLIEASNIAKESSKMALVTQEWMLEQMQTADQLLRQVDEIQSLANSGISDLSAQISTIENSHIVKKHLETRKTLDQLKIFSAGLYKITQYFLHKKGGFRDKDGNRVGVVQLKNVNLFGATAREKRKAIQESK
jgi:hypothetical protein